MLRAFKISSFEKTVFRNCSIFSVSGMTKTGVADTGYKFIQDHKNPDQSFSGFSSTGATRKFSAGKSGLERLHLDYDVRETDDVTLNYPTLPDNCDPLPEVLQNGEESLLKVDNLELLRNIANGDNDVFELLKDIQVRLDITACQYGVTLNLVQEDWLELLNSTYSKRKNLAAFLILNTLRELKRQHDHPPPLYDLPEDDDVEDECNALHNDVRCYHLFHNALFMKLRSTAIKRMYYSKGLAAMLYSSGIVIDCSYDNFMASFEIKDLAKQLNCCASINCRSEYPFHLMLCNFNKDDKLGQILKRINPIVYSDEFPLTVTNKSYLDIFPKDELIYLTPHCKKPLRYCDPNKTYIIGGFIDKTQKKPISMAKAKEHGIEMARLPLDEFLDWGTGDKCLSLPHVLQILLELRATNGDWFKAFEFIPKRCLVKNKVKHVKVDVETVITNIYDSLK